MTDDDDELFTDLKLFYDCPPVTTVNDKSAQVKGKVSGDLTSLFNSIGYF